MSEDLFRGEDASAVAGRPSGATAPDAVPLQPAIPESAPAAVIVDSALRIAYFFGDTSPFIAMPPGRPDWCLTGLLAEGLPDPVRRLVDEARNSATVRRGTALVRLEEAFTRVLIAATPLTPGKAGALLISFRWADGGLLAAPDGLAADSALQRADGKSALDERIAARADGVAAASPINGANLAPGMADWSVPEIDDLQIANEELQAANEELRAQAENDERQKIVIGELRHRIKNILNTVQAVAMQTVRRSDSLEGFRDAFLQRVQALAACQDLLVQTGWRSAKLGDLVEASLQPHLRGGHDYIDNSCADLTLSAGAAQAVVMMLHELATNAVKYGALSSERGVLAVGCDYDAGDGMVSINWSERGGPPAKPPTRTGFGMRLVESTVRKELGGEIALDFRPEGLQATVRFPLAGD
jgi:two-component sensor histidine kinase